MANKFDELKNRFEVGDEDDAYLPLRVMLPLIVVSLFAIFVCTKRIFITYFSSMDMVVGGSYKICEEPLHNRCVTHYRVEYPNGEEGDFVPFGYQFNHDILMTNPHIAKEEYSFIYKINGDNELWPYLWKHVFVLFLGCGGVIIWFKFKGYRSFKSPWRKWSNP